MILMEDIVRDGHPALRKKSEEVSFPLKKDEIDLLNSMREYLINSQDEEVRQQYDLRSGVGLAAPQLGVNKRLIAVYFEEGEKVHDYQLVNPKIIGHSVEQAYLINGEGCLSVDEVIEGYVLRYHRVTVRAYDLEGKEIRLRLKGYPAIVVQHEIDHLNGIMFYDHINKDNPFIAPDQAVALE